MYGVDCEDVVDLRADAPRRAAGVDLADLACPWAQDLNAGRAPASWGVVRRLMAAGATGILVPSFTNGASADGHNLVLWCWGADLPHRVTVHDPSGRLPRNAMCWV